MEEFLLYADIYGIRSPARWEAIGAGGTVRENPGIVALLLNYSVLVATFLHGHQRKPEGRGRVSFPRRTEANEAMAGVTARDVAKREAATHHALRPCATTVRMGCEQRFLPKDWRAQWLLKRAIRRRSPSPSAQFFDASPGYVLFLR
ncbi:hypothetical protein MRX96_029665 [Rhipicephalus microplus]